MQLLEVLKRDLGSPEKAIACFDRLIELLKSGRVDDEFERDRLGLLACVLTVASAVLARIAELADQGHDHQPVFAAAPLDANVNELFGLMGGKAPQGAVEGRVGNTVIRLLLPLLLYLLSDSVRKYLKGDGSVGFASPAQLA